MKKRFTAAVVAALIAVAFLFAQGPVQKVRLWDTNLSHSLLLKWNEDRAAGYTLNWIGITGDRTITLQGNPTLDDWFNQSVKTTFSPTFKGATLSYGPEYTGGLVMKHSNVAHGITGFAETDTYFDVTTNYDASWIGTATQGGPCFGGYSEGEIVYGLHAFYTTGVTSRSNPMAPVSIFARKISGTGEGNPADNESILSLSHGPTVVFNPDWTACVGGKVYHIGATSGLFINEDSNANQTCGITLNQGAADDAILSLKSSDVSHGMSTIAEIDTYGYFQKADGAVGGLQLSGMTESYIGLSLRSAYTSEDTTRTTSSSAAIMARGYKKSGTSVGNPGANGNLFGIAGNATTAWICDFEGDTWQPGKVTASQGILTMTTGMAPLVIASETEVDHLNAHLLQGYHASAFELALGNPATSGHVLSSTDAGVRSWVFNVSSFVDLDDVPANYAGSGGYVVKVNAGATGLEFVAGGAGVSSFVDLDDVPASYVSQAAKYLKVKATEDGLEFASAPGGGAPSDAKYIVQEADGDLSAEQSLGALATGIVKNTTTAGVGVLSIASAGTDYLTTAAPVDAKYIVGLANATLSAEKVKAQLYNNYDIDDAPASPNGMDDEFDDSSLDGKWTKVNEPAAPNAISEAAFPGYVWIGLPEITNDPYYVNLIQAYQAPPGGDGSSAMEFIAKVAVANKGSVVSGYGQWAAAGIIFINSTDNEYVLSYGSNRSASSCFGQSAGGINGATADKIITAITTSYPLDYPQSGFVYVKLAKTTTAAWTSANTYDTYASLNGIVWIHTGTCSKTFTHAIDRIGLVFRAITPVAGDPLANAVVDFFRRTI